jgi:acetyltransferase-like isoleucine patch superfamily enzyme
VIALNLKNAKPYISKGTGKFKVSDFKSLGENVIFENGVRVFHPENICIGDNVYVGHDTVLEGYHKNEMIIGDHTWIGQGSFFHSAGGIEIGRAVGIGPAVKILTSIHREGALSNPIIHNKLRFGKVVIKDGSDIGTGAMILPGVTIGEGTLIGAQSVVTKDVDEYVVAAGNPVRVLRRRE